MGGREKARERGIEGTFVKLKENNLFLISILILEMLIFSEVITDQSLLSLASQNASETACCLPLVSWLD